jgi:hypothetical protein
MRRTPSADTISRPHAPSMLGWSKRFPPWDTR